MKNKVALYSLAALMAVAPVSSASAHGGWRHHDGPILGLFALGAAAVAGTAYILTAPVRAVAEAAVPPYYGPQGYGPPPGYYAPQQAYYPPPQPYYAPPPAYYAQPTAYYAAPPAYYYGH